MAQYEVGDTIYVEFVDDQNHCLYFAEVLGVLPEEEKVVVNDLFIAYDKNGDELMENYKLPSVHIKENFHSTPLNKIKELKPSLFV